MSVGFESLFTSTADFANRYKKSYDESKGTARIYNFCANTACTLTTIPLEALTAAENLLIRIPVRILATVANYTLLPLGMRARILEEGGQTHKDLEDITKIDLWKDLAQTAIKVFKLCLGTASTATIGLFLSTRVNVDIHNKLGLYNPNLLHPALQKLDQLGQELYQANKSIVNKDWIIGGADAERRSLKSGHEVEKRNLNEKVALLQKELFAEKFRADKLTEVAERTENIIKALLCDDRVKDQEIDKWKAENKKLREELEAEKAKGKPVQPSQPEAQEPPAESPAPAVLAPVVVDQVDEVIPENPRVPSPVGKDKDKDPEDYPEIEEHVTTHKTRAEQYQQEAEEMHEEMKRLRLVEEELQRKKKEEKRLKQEEEEKLRLQQALTTALRQDLQPQQYQQSYDPYKNSYNLHGNSYSVQPNYKTQKNKQKLEEEEHYHY